MFIDIVGYSKLLINEQRELLEELNHVVRGTGTFREAEAAGKLIKLPSGDGMALVFSTSPEALFIDIVGYSKLSINDQHAAVEELNRDCSRVRAISTSRSCEAV